MMSAKLKIALSAMLIIISSFLAQNLSAQEMTKEVEFDICLERINAIAKNTLSLYAKGLKDEARLEWQRAYFENFENLEGPIRRKISAKRNIELEEEFGNIRKMIKEGRPYTQVSDSIAGLLNELEKTVMQLKGKAIAIVFLGHKDKGQKLAQEISQAVSWGRVSDEIRNKVGEVIVSYSHENSAAASAKIQDIYFDIFEASGMEGKIVSLDLNLNARIESGFTKIAALMNAGKAKKDIDPAFALLQKDLGQATEILSHRRQAPLSLFLYSLLIILREGFEAILIICAIIAYLIKTGHKDKVKVIYNGCIMAIIFSFITAILVKWVFHISPANQEILEGITMLIATIVLFFVSFWLISKVEAHKWMNYIKSKVDRSLTTGSTYALWFTAFLVVYREGAETILFYQALGSDLNVGGIGVILAGFIIGCIGLAAIFAGVRFSSMRLPLKPFFIVTSALLYYMAFVFAGKGVMELIEGRLIKPSFITHAPTINFLGVYPYWQTIIPQALLIIAAFIGLYITFIKSTDKNLFKAKTS